MKQNTDFILHLQSSDDHLIPIEEGRYVNQQLQPHSEYVEFHDQGHFIVDESEVLYQQIVNKLKKHNLT